MKVTDMQLHKLITDITELAVEAEKATALRKENHMLKNLIFNMTHHKGALEETKDEWMEVIKERLKGNRL
tara:strand:+ start:767 stop:976 length:210 start_codon:yes stop_codon:yes gene_type:complete